MMVTAHLRGISLFSLLFFKKKKSVKGAFGIYKLIRPTNIDLLLLTAVFFFFKKKDIGGPTNYTFFPVFPNFFF